MADTSIEWTDKVWNVVRGCAIVSEGCRNCYAMKQAHRFSGEGGAYEGLTKVGANGPVWEGSARFIPEMLFEPFKWKKPQRVFVNSMSDLFHEDVTDDEVVKIFGVMGAASQHTFQVLTKRPERMRKFLNDGSVQDMIFDEAVDNHPDGGVPAGAETHAFPFPNLWLGASIEDQPSAERRVPDVLATPAAVRFLSIEPLLGPLDLSFSCKPWGPDGASAAALSRIGWVIVGGESGPRARPMKLEWARAIRNQAAERGVPFFFKQWGNTVPTSQLTDAAFSMLDASDGPYGGCVHHHNDVRLPKKLAGRELDGRTWDEMPAVRR